MLQQSEIKEDKIEIWPNVYKTDNLSSFNKLSDKFPTILMRK